eukprot:Rhum_TRINITY_DN3855_c0_g1::Rhum_TRINITY_DN3855_c0_g1_i1::g.12139::m.12139
MRSVHWINALSRRDLLALSGRADRLSADVASRALCSLLGGGVPSEAETSQAAEYLTPLKRSPPSSSPAFAELRRILAALTKTKTQTQKQPDEVSQFLREAEATVAAPPLPPVVVAARVDSGLAQQQQQPQPQRGGRVAKKKPNVRRPAAAVSAAAATAQALLQPGDSDEVLAGLTPAQCMWVAEFTRSEAAMEEAGRGKRQPPQLVLRGRPLRARVLRPLVKRLAALYAAQGGDRGGKPLPLPEGLLRFAFEEGRVAEPALLPAYLASGEAEGEAAVAGAGVPSVAALDTLVRVYGSESATAPFGRAEDFFPRSLLLEKTRAVLVAASGSGADTTAADAVVSAVAALWKLCADALVLHSVDRRLAAAAGEAGEGKMPAEAAAYVRCVDAACALALQAVGELPRAAVPPVLVRLSALAHLCADAEGLWRGSGGGGSEEACLRHRATLHKLALRTLHRSLEQGAVNGLSHASVALCCLAGGGGSGGGDEMLEETLAAYIATQLEPVRIATPLLAYVMQLLPRRSRVLEHYVSSHVRQGDVAVTHPRALVALGPRLSVLLMGHVAVPPRALWLADGAWARLLTLHLADPETAILPMLMHEVTRGL